MSMLRPLHAVALLLTASALFAARPAHAEAKIAYVDLQRALNEVEEGRGAKAALKKEFESKQKMLDDKKAEFEKLRGEYEKQASVMSEDSRKAKEADLQKKGGELQGFFVQQQKDLSDREREVTRGIFEKMSAIVREIADAEGVSIVLQAEAIVYGAPSLDLTNDLVRKYNARYKAGAASAASDKDGKKTAKKESGK